MSDENGCSAFVVYVGYIGLILNRAIRYSRGGPLEVIHRKQLTVERAKSAMETGEFPKEVIGSNKHVAVVLTQDWCSQWSQMKFWLKSLEKEESPEGSPQDLDIDVYEFVYNTVDIFQSFMDFKERSFKNGLIPYIRYYSNGNFTGDSNFTSSPSFLDRFKAE